MITKITSIKNKAEDEIYPKNDETPGKLLQIAQKMTVKKKRKNPNQTKIFYMLIQKPKIQRKHRYL